LLIAVAAPTLASTAASALLQSHEPVEHLTDSRVVVQRDEKNGAGVVEDEEQNSLPSVAKDDPVESTAHPVARLLGEQHSLVTLLICALAAVVVAPLIEEFFFRVLLQGWLEAREDQWRARLPVMPRLPRGSVPILLSAALFALLHARGEEAQFDSADVMMQLTAGAAGSLAAIGFSILLLHTSCGATATDMGIGWKKLGGDATLGLAGLAAVFVPINALQWGLYKLQESHLADNLVAPDPVPLFFLALVLGYLYQRTHRLGPGVVLHMAFNAIPLGILWFATSA
jgi:membrane protease YdiL (CAAX protease family)